MLEKGIYFCKESLVLHFAFKVMKVDGKTPLQKYLMNVTCYNAEFDVAKC